MPYTPAIIESNVLTECCNLLDVACILARRYLNGSRQDLVMAFSGFAAKNNIPISITQLIISAICHCCNDEEEGSRLAVVERTYARHDAGDRISGFNALKELIGENCVNDIRELLGISSSGTPRYQRPETQETQATERIVNIIKRDLQAYYRFSHADEKGLFSTRMKKYITKKDLKEPLNQTQLDYIRSKAIEARKGSRMADYSMIPALYRSFSPTAIQELSEELPRKAPVTGFSVEEDGIYYLTGKNGVFEIRNNQLIETDKIAFNSDDEFEVATGVQTLSPAKIFCIIYTIIINFNWRNPIQAVVFVLYLFYLGIWDALKQRIHAIINGLSGSGKTALSCTIASPISGGGDISFKGFGLIPNSMRARCDSTLYGIQTAIPPNCCLVLDEAETDQEGNNVNRHLNALRSSSGGGEIKYRGGNWHNDKLYPPTTIIGIHIQLSETDTSRFLIFDLLQPGRDDAPIMPFLHCLKPFRNELASMIILSLMPFIEDIKASMVQNNRNNRMANIFLPLVAIFDTAIMPTINSLNEDEISLVNNLREQFMTYVETTVESANTSIRTESSGKTKILEIINTPITFVMGDELRPTSQKTTILEFTERIQRNAWCQIGWYQAYVRRGQGERPKIALRYELLTQLNYDPAWSKTLKNQSGFSKFCERNQIGTSETIRIGQGKTIKAVILNDSIFESIYTDYNLPPVDSSNTDDASNIIQFNRPAREGMRDAI